VAVQAGAHLIQVEQVEQVVVAMVHILHPQMPVLLTQVAVEVVGHLQVAAQAALVLSFSDTQSLYPQ
jgi:hypothetical protein